MTATDSTGGHNLRLIRWLTCLMFFTFAMTTDAVGSVIPQIIDQFALSMKAASAFQYATMGGIAAGALLLGFLADRLGRKRTIILGLALYGASSLVFAVGDAFATFVALLAAAGLGISIFKIGALALIGDISASTTSHTRFMNTVEGFFAVGAIVGPASVATLIAAGTSWKWLYIIAAGICVVLVAIASLVRYPHVKASVERASLRQMVEVMKDPLALGFSTLVALYVAVEGAIYVWMPTYLRDYHGTPAWLPSYALTIFFVLRAIGRFLGAWFLGRVVWTVALALLSGAIFLCFLGSLVWGVEGGAWLLPLSGLFMSVMYPTLNSKGISCFPKSHHGAAAGVILFFTAAAAALGPLSMAAVSDASGSSKSGFVLATALAFLLLAGLTGNWLLNPARRRLERSDLKDYGNFHCMKNQIQLILYADRLGGTLRGVHDLLRGPLKGLFGGVHLLPFFHPSNGSDAGFDPIDHTEVDQRLGSWDDVRAIGDDVDVMADVIVNHISSLSPQFLDFSAKGATSPYAGMFLTFESVFPDGATEEDLLAIYRPRPGLPFTPMTLADGSRRILWTTFTSEQIDIDVNHPEGMRYLENILRIFAANGIRMVRLDAVGYAIKKRGRSSFMMEETLEFIGRFSAQAKRLGLEVLVEIHSYYQHQIEVARHVDWVYDFALPPLVLHAFFNRTARNLKHWIDMRPVNALTVLDTHDGIGVIDIGPDSQDRAGHPGLVHESELAQLVQRIHANSNGESLRATGSAASNLDLYQVNCTFYDALGRDDVKYLLARAIQFFLPGIPQVYYVGLLAGHNDMQLLADTGVGRDINRHYYTRSEIGPALEKPTVERLLQLIRLRNSHPAFHGIFDMAPTPDDVLELQWRNGGEFAKLRIDLRTGNHHLQFSRGQRLETFRFLEQVDA